MNSKTFRRLCALYAQSYISTLYWIPVATSLLCWICHSHVLLLVPFLIWRDPSTIRAETSHKKPTSFYFGQFMKPAHVINYIIPAMAPTRGRPLFNCFRAQVHACTRCLQSKVVPFQQAFMEANVKGGPGAWATRRLRWARV